MQTEEKNDKTKRLQSKRRNCLWKRFHLFKHIIAYENIRFFSLISLRTCSKWLNDLNSLHYFMWSFMYHLLHFSALTSSNPYKFCLWIYEFFKNHPWGGVLGNVNLNCLENLLKRNLGTDSAREGIFRTFGGTNFENVPAWCQSWWCLCGFDVYTSLPKKRLDMSPDINSCVPFWIWKDWSWHFTSI